jgi:DNA (cytosine-5)-methyltransferase 1
MTQPRLLDLCCSEGGAAMGYRLAGYEVVGVDIDPQPLYPFEFHQADALDFLRAHADEFDAFHISPPCQYWSTITPASARDRYPQMIAPARELLTEIGKPFVIENVTGARRQLRNPIMLCGSSFELRVRRHRYFESNVPLTGLPCDHVRQGQPLGVYGSHGDKGIEYVRPGGGRRGRKAADVTEARLAMGMPWASWHGCAEAIPPAYTKHIGQQLLA